MLQKPRLLKIFLATVFCLAFLLAAGEARAAQLTVNSSNQHYWNGMDGKPVLFLSHSSNSIIDGDFTDANWKWYIDQSVANGLNLAKLGLAFADSAENVEFNRLSPYIRVTDHGKTNFGNYKFDLDQFNQAYFTNLRDIINYAQTKGLYVHIQIWNGVNFKAGSQKVWHWKGNVFNPDNSIIHTGNGNEITTTAGYGWGTANNITGVTVFHNSLNNTVKVAGKTLLQRQEALFDKLVNETKDFSNVFYELGNEVAAGTAWAEHWTARLDSIASGKLMIAGTTHYTGSVNTFDGTTKHEVSFLDDSIPEAIYGAGKMGLEDADYTGDWAGSDSKKARQASWRSVLSGVGWVDFRTTGNMLNGVGTTPTNMSWKYPEVVAQIKNIRNFFSAKKIPFVNMKPFDSLATSGSEVLYGLGKYVIYAVDNNFQITLPAGTYTVEWYNPRTGAYTSAGEKTGGVQLFTLPTTDDWVLYLVSATPYIDPIPLPIPPPPAGVLGLEKLIGTGKHPSIAVSPVDGTLHIVYANSGLRYRSYNPASGVLSSEELVTSGQVWWPQVAVSGDGNVHVVWEEDPGKSYIGYSRRISGVWKSVGDLNPGSSFRAMMPRIDVDSNNRAHIVFWQNIKGGTLPRGQYNRIGLSGGLPKIELTKDISEWENDRFGDIVVDSSSIPHLFINLPDKILQITVSESGEFTAAAPLLNPEDPNILKTMEGISVSTGAGGGFYGFSKDAGLDECKKEIFHTRIGGPSKIVWDSPLLGHSLVATGDLAVNGRAYVVFAGEDKKGRVLSIDSNGGIIGPILFASAGNQHDGADRHSPGGVAVNGGGLWVASQDDRNGTWQIYIRKVNFGASVASSCGNGVVDTGETCDSTLASSCPLANACNFTCTACAPIAAVCTGTPFSTPTSTLTSTPTLPPTPAYVTPTLYCLGLGIKSCLGLTFTQTPTPTPSNQNTPTPTTPTPSPITTPPIIGGAALLVFLFLSVVIYYLLKQRKI